MKMTVMRVLEVKVDEAIVEYILAIAEATRRAEELSIGLSPRGSLGLMQAQRARPEGTPP